MPQTVSPPPDVCTKCGWYIAYAPTHYRMFCNPVGGQAADAVSSKISDVARGTKKGHQDSLTVVLPGGETLVLKAGKDGRFTFEGFNAVHDYGEVEIEEVIRLFAQISAVKGR